jgi:hypothetical protein
MYFITKFRAKQTLNPDFTISLLSLFSLPDTVLENKKGASSFDQAPP